MLWQLRQVVEHLVGMTVKTPSSTPRTAKDDDGELNGEVSRSSELQQK
jgi:hypothetical protein